MAPSRWRHTSTRSSRRSRRSSTMAVTATKSAARSSPAPSRTGPAAVTAALLLTLAVLATIDITQGTAATDADAVFKALTGRAGAGDASVVIASRLPRMVAGLLVGAVLGIAGAALQAVSRNVLASPDTLAVNAGSYLALSLMAVTGVSLPCSPPPVSRSSVPWRLRASSSVCPASARAPSGSFSPAPPWPSVSPPSRRDSSCCSPSRQRGSTSGTRAASARTGSTAYCRWRPSRLSASSGYF